MNERQRLPTADAADPYGIVRSAYETGPSFHDDRGPREPATSLWSIDDPDTDEDAIDPAPC